MNTDEKKSSPEFFFIKVRQDADCDFIKFSGQRIGKEGSFKISAKEMEELKKTRLFGLVVTCKEQE